MFCRLLDPNEQANYYLNKYIVLLHKRALGESIVNKVRRVYYRGLLQKKYNILIGANAYIGENNIFPHPQNIVIGSGVIIGNECTIYHDVTLGQNHSKYPVVGNHVVIYPGAKIIGDISIGDNSIIGANAVVTKNIPQDVIAAGVPAKIIKSSVVAGLEEVE